MFYRDRKCWESVRLLVQKPGNGSGPIRGNLMLRVFCSDEYDSCKKQVCSTSPSPEELRYSRKRPFIKTGKMDKTKKQVECSSSSLKYGTSVFSSFSQEYKLYAGGEGQKPGNTFQKKKKKKMLTVYFCFSVWLTCCCSPAGQLFKRQFCEMSAQTSLSSNSSWITGEEMKRVEQNFAVQRQNLMNYTCHTSPVTFC